MECTSVFCFFFFFIFFFFRIEWNEKKIVAQHSKTNVRMSVSSFTRVYLPYRDAVGCDFFRPGKLFLVVWFSWYTFIRSIDGVIALAYLQKRERKKSTLKITWNRLIKPVSSYFLHFFLVWVFIQHTSMYI